MNLEFNGAVFTPNGFGIPKDVYYNYQCEIINEKLKVYTFLDGKDVPLVESRLIDLLKGKRYHNKIFLILLKNEYNGILLKNYERVMGTEDFLNRHNPNTNMELVSVKLISKNTGEAIKLI